MITTDSIINVFIIILATDLLARIRRHAINSAIMPAFNVRIVVTSFRARS